MALVKPFMNTKALSMKISPENRGFSSLNGAKGKASGTFVKISLKMWVPIFSTPFSSTRAFQLSLTSDA